MSERSEWLARGFEEALEPDIPICDPHHHLWEHPNSRYLLEEFRADLADGHPVVGTVFVECLQKYREQGPDRLRPVGETEFVEALTRNEPGCVAAGIVGFADLNLGAAVREVLEAHLEASPRFRGIRHASAWHENEKIHNAHTRPPAGLLLHDRFREGFACLGEMGLTFDAWLYHPQVNDLIDLARSFPDTTIVLDHMAGPLGIGPYANSRDAVFAEWGEMMERLADCTNVSVKLGGRGMSMAGYGWHKQDEPPGSAELAAAWAPYFDLCIERFGPERCMFESNFPMDKVSCSYTVLWNAFKRASRKYAAVERSALLCQTARRVYNLDVKDGD
jgi:predicted TIM-barrel fold metal-dependent hydrolase